MFLTESMIYSKSYEHKQIKKIKMGDKSNVSVINRSEG